MQIKLSQISLAVVASTLLLSSTSALAAHAYKGEGNYKGEAMAAPVAPCVQPLMLHDGFYLGAQVGYDNWLTGVSGNTPAIGATGVVLNGSRDLIGLGVVGGIFGGYGMYWNNLYYLGGELYVNDSDAGGRVTSTAVGGALAAVAPGIFTSNRVSIGWSWGASLLPGVKLNDSTLAYVRLGYSQARVRGSETYNVGAAALAAASWNTMGAFQYGLGLETAVWPQLSVRGEYSHAGYGTFTNAATGTRYSPSNNQFMVGLVYHFM